jgi:hypothetical protein
VVVVAEDVVLAQGDPIERSLASSWSTRSRPSQSPASGWSPGRCHTTSAAIKEATAASTDPGPSVQHLEKLVRGELDVLVAPLGGPEVAGGD